jgi:hypothetical protein
MELQYSRSIITWESGGRLVESHEKLELNFAELRFGTRRR